MYKRTHEDLTEKEIDLFIANYPYKTANEIKYMTQLDYDEIKKLKNKIQEEKGISLVKNKNYVMEITNPPAKTQGISLNQSILNHLEEDERREMMEFAQNKPDNAAVLSELVIYLRQRFLMGLTYEIKTREHGLNENTDKAANTLIYGTKSLDEIQNGIKLNQEIEHSIVNVIRDVREKVNEGDNPNLIE